jgi:MoxR-like ATPase
MTSVEELRNRLQDEIKQVFYGQEEVTDFCLMALLCEGHILIEGVPGTAKTLLARSIAAALDLDFGRIQFTPDLLPNDITGTNVFNFHANEFVLNKGPVFNHILLGDEINRSPPKTQSALLESMQERQVTIDNDTYDLEEPFLVIATQNPIEHEGTYPLPEAQLDRFLFKTHMEYPEKEVEERIVAAHSGNQSVRELSDTNVRPVASREDLLEARDRIKSVEVREPVVDYVVRLVRRTREAPRVNTGASPRASVMLTVASKAMAALEGREYIIPDDVKRVLLPTLRHRLVLSPESEIEGITADRVLKDIVEQVEVPR